MFTKRHLHRFSFIVLVGIVSLDSFDVKKKLSPIFGCCSLLLPVIFIVPSGAGIVRRSEGFINNLHFHFYNTCVFFCTISPPLLGVSLREGYNCVQRDRSSLWNQASLLNGRAVTSRGEMCCLLMTSRVSIALAVSPKGKTRFFRSQVENAAPPTPPPLHCPHFFFLHFFLKLNTKRLENILSLSPLHEPYFPITHCTQSATAPPLLRGSLQFAFYETIMKTQNSDGFILYIIGGGKKNGTG